VEVAVGKIRVERVREKVKNEVARILQTELNDPRMGFVTITKVDLTPDFREAKVYWTSLGSETDQRRVTRMLEDARGFIQREVAGTLRTRVTPILKFVHDESTDKSFRVAEILEQIKKEKGPAELERSEGLEDSASAGKADNENKHEASDDDEDDEEDDDDGDDDDEEDEDDD
jgi:ribosome-binding factor A